MKFKVEVSLGGRTVTKVFYADDLEQLDKQVMKDFPKGKIISILGG